MTFRSHNPICYSFLLCFLGFLPTALHAASECDTWQSRKPEWIFCDDFEKGGALVAPGRYFEYGDNQGDFVPSAGAGLQGSIGMRALWQSGEVDAGSLKLGFGRAPGTYFSRGIRTDTDFREIYYRVYMRLQKGWQGNPYKLSRATIMAKSDWSQAMIAHLWGDNGQKLALDPASCTDTLGAVKCSGYNDFNNIRWIGAKSGLTPVYGGSHDDQWLCVEAHVRLNDSGQTNGLHEFWMGGTLEARREGLNFLGGYKEYGINAVFFENYWNSGSPRLQERTLDNIVVSTQRIGCAADSGVSNGLQMRSHGRRITTEGYVGQGWGAYRTLIGRKLGATSDCRRGFVLCPGEF